MRPGEVHPLPPPPRTSKEAAPGPVGTPDPSPPPCSPPPPLPRWPPWLSPLPACPSGRLGRLLRSPPSSLPHKPRAQARLPVAGNGAARGMKPWCIPDLEGAQLLNAPALRGGDTPGPAGLKRQMAQASVGTVTAQGDRCCGGSNPGPQFLPSLFPLPRPARCHRGRTPPSHPFFPPLTVSAPCFLSSLHAPIPWKSVPAAPAHHPPNRPV